MVLPLFLVVMLVVLGRKQVVFSIQCQSASLGPGLRPILAMHPSLPFMPQLTQPVPMERQCQMSFTSSFNPLLQQYQREIWSSLWEISMQELAVTMKYGGQSSVVIVQINVMRMVNGCLTSVPAMTLLSLTLVPLTRPSTSVHGSATVTALGLEG